MRRFALGLTFALLLIGVVFAACSGPAAPADVPPEAAPTAPAAAADAAPAADDLAAPVSGEVRTFAIDPARSTARFELDEMLMGSPKRVVGATQQVTGTLTVDLADHRRTQLSPIQIDARSLETDDSFRNRALRRQILQSQEDAYQFITFTPTTLTGLPETTAVGSSLAFSVTGDLQIREIVQPVTFDVTVTPVSESEIQGSAQATVQRAGFDLRIPSVPSVANVSEEVLLALDFVAVAE